MILFYIDESGTGWEDKQTDFFSLGSFAIHVNDWQRMDREIREIKEGFFTQGKSTEWEIKGRDIWQGLGKLKRKNREYRNRIFWQIAEALNSLNCYLGGVIVNKESLVESGIKIQDTTELYQFTFNYFMERLDDFLKQQHQVGILLMDSRSTFRTAVQDTRLIKAYQKWAELRTPPSSFVELPWFARSDIHTGLQLADYVAYLISRRPKELKKRVVDNALLEAFNLLEPKINLFEIPDKGMK